MNITINGQNRDWTTPTDLKGVIEHFTKDAKRVVAELNGQIILRERWAATDVQDGDRIELVTFVGGG